MRIPIVTFDNPVLRTPSIEVRHKDIGSTGIQELIDNMHESMIEADGVGIAAPQVGYNLRLFWVKYKEHEFVALNPQITIKDPEIKTGEEGCLSYPNIFGNVQRAKALTLFATDRNGKEFTVEASGWLARVIQHEYDHINGKVIVDKFTN